MQPLPQPVPPQPSRIKRRPLRSPHPGVYLVGRPGRAWQAKWRDPDRGNRWTAISLGACGLDLRTHEMRVTWAIAKARTLKARRAAIESGEAATAGLPIPEAVDEFLKVKTNEGKPRTVAGLRLRLRAFLTWTSRESAIRSTADIKGPDLYRFRDHVLTLRRTAPKSGGVGRGARAETTDLLSPGSRNSFFSSAMRFLNWARKRGLLRLSRDAIGDALMGYRVEPPRTIIKDRSIIRALLKAALHRDRVRAESAASALVLFALMTGARRDEIKGLDWSEVSLDGPGAIEFPALRTKTLRGRRVDLGVSPTVKAMLAARWLRAGRPSSGLVFGGTSMRVQEDLIRTYAAPYFTWQICRSTCGSFLACAKGLNYTFPMVAGRLGHEVRVCEKRRPLAVDPIHASRFARTLSSATRNWRCAGSSRAQRTFDRPTRRRSPASASRAAEQRPQSSASGRA